MNVMKLPQLMELKLDGLQYFTNIFSGNDIEISAKPFFSTKVEVPTLEKLKINRMSNLKGIWGCRSESNEEVDNNSGSMLREIIVEECDHVVNLFPSNPTRLLSYLEELNVEKCCSIEVLFDIDLGKIEQLSSSSSKLRRISVKYLKKLREVWRIKDAENNYSPHHHLLISGFQAVESIDIRYCEKFRNVFTPTITHFDMRALTKIRISNCGEGSVRNNAELDDEIINSQEQEIKAMPEEEKSSNVSYDKKSTVAFPSHQLTHTNSSYLRKIELKRFKGVEVVFEMEKEISINKELVSTPQQPLLLLPCLEKLRLESMDDLTHVWKWKCDWSEFLILHNMKHQPQSPFQNLTTINLLDCKSIKYLFSPLMAKLLSNLKTVEIWSCDSMEEVVSQRDDKEKEMTFTTLFPFLHTLSLYSLPCLKHIGGGDVVAKDTSNVGDTSNVNDHDKISQVDDVVPWSLCQYSREIDIRWCEALSSVIPCYALREMQRLEVLRIYNCSSIVEVFETTEISKTDCSSSTSGRNIDQGNSGTMDTTLAIPRTDNITVLRLSNLTKLEIGDCDHLEYIFTFSTLKSLRQLQKLNIKKCKAMKVIVREENEKQMSSYDVVVVFPRLKSIELDHLPNLLGFSLGMNDFVWPSLKFVMINDCPRMMVFTSGRSEAPRLYYMHTGLGKYRLELGLNFNQMPSVSVDGSCLSPAPCSFHNIIEINVEHNQDLHKIIPSNELLHLAKLEKIHVSDCRNVEEVFEVASKVVVPNLREVELKYLDSLKYIWKGNQSIILEFPNLTRLSIKYCGGLKHVLTCSMVGSLLQLQELHVSHCESMEVIVKEEKEEEEEEKEFEIILPCLNSLKLEYLPILKGFCLENKGFSFPSLDTLVIKECPELMIFTKGHLYVQELAVVETSLGLFYAEEDINSFIITNKTKGLNL